MVDASSPSGLPAEIAVRVLQALSQGFLADPGRAKMRALDVTPVVSTPQEFARTMAHDARHWRELAERLGIKPE